MDRKDFLKNMAVLGLGAPFIGTLLSACEKEDFLSNSDLRFDGKVIVIGAGAAGITAGYILQRQGIDFEIIEASSVHGGRIKKIDGFADFPIDLGAEWIHTDPSILSELLDDPSVNANIDIITYQPQKLSFYRDGKLRKRNFFNNFYSEYKFKNTTWFDFFDQYMIPSIQDRITYNSPITTINYSGEKVSIRNKQGREWTADKVLVTVPIKVLQDNLIDFQPTLPSSKQDALAQIDIPAGLKVFIEFSQKFYPDVVNIGSLGTFLSGNEGDKLYYDAAFRKEAERHVLGLFTVGPRAGDLVNLGSNDAIFDNVMEELDSIFEGQASKYYKNHVIQNWSAEPYIRGSYSHFLSRESPVIDALLAPLNEKVYFAGEALSYDNYSTVHGAAQTAYSTLEVMLAG